VPQKADVASAKLLVSLHVKLLAQLQTKNAKINRKDKKTVIYKLLLFFKCPLYHFHSIIILFFLRKIFI